MFNGDKWYKVSSSVYYLLLFLNATLDRVLLDWCATVCVCVCVFLRVFVVRVCCRKQIICFEFQRFETFKYR